MKLFRRRYRRVQIDITCPHGRFIPATYELGRRGRLGCQHCDFHVRLSWPVRADTPEPNRSGS